MSENKIGDISNISNSTVIIGDNNQSNNITIQDIFSEAKELIVYYKAEQTEKREKLRGVWVPIFCFCVFIILLCCFFFVFFPKETPLTIGGFIVGLIGAGFSIYAYFDGLEKPNQTQKDYCARYNEIIRILNYNRRKDLVSELERYLRK